MLDWILEFPAMSRRDLSAVKRSVDQLFIGFTREYGESVENFFAPLDKLLGFVTNTLLHTPWPLIIIAFALIAHFATRNPKLVFSSVFVLLVIGYLGMWEDTMRTMSMIIVCTLVTMFVGIPCGIFMSRSKIIEKISTPLLDVMQTMPSFVYLIPVVMLLGIGNVPGLIAVVIYSLPPIVRLTNLGIRLVDKQILEAAYAFGANPKQTLWHVQLPLALPTIMAGVNQTIMMALAMVVVASMIGVQGLGQPVLKAINNQYFTLGILNGLAIVSIAIIFDRVSQSYGKRLQKHLEVAV